MSVLPCLSFAQFTIEGKVTDKSTGNPLLGAHVFIENTFKIVSTDNNGNYKITSLKGGQYTIKATYIGYSSIQKTIEVKANASLNFEMEINPILEDEVIISATRADEKSPTTYQNISKRKIADMNLGQDIPFLLALTPSVVVTSDAGAGIGYTGLRIRGTDITRINVTINGIPLNDPESQGVYWVNLPDFASSIDNIQIQRGVGTSTNGAAAFGASINIQTQKMNPTPYSEINSSAGSFNTLKNSLSFGTGLIDNKWSVDARLSKITSDGYIDRAFSDLKSFYISGSYYGKKSLLKLNIYSGKEKTYQAWGGVPKDSLNTNRTYNQYTYENETDNYQQDHYQLLFSKEFSKSLHFNASLFYIKGRGYYEQFKEDRDLQDYLLDPVYLGSDTVMSTDLIQRKWLDNNFYGFTYSLTYKKKKTNVIIGGSWNKYDGDHFGDVIWAKYASNGKINYRWYENTGYKTDFNLFVKLNYQVLKRINFYGDIQYRNINYEIDGKHDDLRDITQDHKFNFINPKLGIFYNVRNNQNIYFSCAISNREPGRNNYRDADKNNEPKSEKLTDYELGYNFRALNVLINANFFYMDYKDQLVITGEINNVGDAIMTNVNESYRMGIEISAAIKLLTNLKWEPNIAFSKNKIKDFIEYVDDWDTWMQIENDLGETDLSFSPGIVAGSLLSYRLIKGLNISLMRKYVGKQYIDNTSGDERSLDAYLVNNIRFNYVIHTKLFKEIGINFLINNALNEEYESNAWVYRYYTGGEYYVMDGYYPQAGRNFLLGIIIKL